MKVCGISDLWLRWGFDPLLLEFNIVYGHNSFQSIFFLDLLVQVKKWCVDSGLMQSDPL